MLCSVQGRDEPDLSRSVSTLILLALAHAPHANGQTVNHACASFGSVHFHGPCRDLAERKVLIAIILHFPRAEKLCLAHFALWPEHTNVEEKKQESISPPLEDI